MNVAPLGWLRLPISEVASFGSGELISVAKLSKQSGMFSVPVFGGNGIAGYTSSATVLEPTVILGRVGQKCGVVYRNDGPAWITDNALYARRFKRPVDVRFFALTLEAARLNDLKNKNDLPLITQSILNDVRIAWPESLAEQRHIADTVSSIDDLIANLHRLITKKQAIKQGLIQQLLTGTTRLSGFTGDWDRIAAGDIGVFKGGSGSPLRFQGAASGKYPFYKVSDMNNEGNELFMRTSNNYVSQHQYKRMGAVLMPADAIVFAKVGAAVLLERKRILTMVSCIDNNLAAFMLDKTRADVRFIHYAMTNFPMGSLVATGALPSLNGRQLRSIPIYLPRELGEQRAIARVLIDADAELTALGGQLTKARAIKRGMMQQLLTGRTRLPLEEATS